MVDIFFYWRFLFTFSLFPFCFLLEFFFVFYFSNGSLSYYDSLHCFFNSALRNDFGKSSEDRSLKIETDVVLYGEKDSRAEVVDRETISVLSVTDSDEFQFRLHGVDLGSGSASDLIVIIGVVIHKNSFRNAYP